MRKLAHITFVFLVIFLSLSNLTAQNISINADGAAPDSSAMLDVSDTTRGFLMPRLSTTQMNNISGPADGLMIFNTDSLAYYFYNGSLWLPISSGSSSSSTFTYEQKTISSDISSTGTISDLSFSGLTIGNTYRVTLSLVLRRTNLSTNDKLFRMVVLNGTDTVAGVSNTVTSEQRDVTAMVNRIFVATASSLTFDVEAITNLTIAGTEATFVNSTNTNHATLENLSASFGGVSSGSSSDTLNLILDADQNSSVIINNDSIFMTNNGKSTVNVSETGGVIVSNPGSTPDGSFVSLSSPGANSGIVVAQGDGSGGVLQRWNMAVYNDSSLQFYPHGREAALTLSNDGNIGIGTDAPTLPLEIKTLTTTLDNPGPLSINSNSIHQYTEGIRIISDSLDAGDDLSIAIGKEGSTNNIGWIGYRYVGDGLDSNALVFNLWNRKRILNITGQRRVGINTLTPEKELDVVGTATVDTLNINSLYNLPSNAPTSGQVIRYNGTDVEWGTASSTPDEIQDADGNTQIQVEENANENIIRFDANGTEVMRIDELSRINVSNTRSSLFIGNQAGNDINTGTQNTFLGYQAGANTTNGSNNTFIGFQAGFVNSTTGNNTFIGALSGDANNSGQENTFIGVQSGSATNSGSHNTFIGKDAGRINTSGNNNTYLGMDAGDINDGSGNVFLGAYSASTLSSANNLLYIENSDTIHPLIYGDFANDSLKVYGTLSISDSITFPTTRGSNGQVLTSDGVGGISWQNAGGSSAEIQDTDGNTQIQVEETANDDIIRFDMSGTEFFRMDSGRFEVINTGNSVIIGDSAGLADDLSGNENTVLGYAAGQIMTGTENVYIGSRAGKNAPTNFNTAVGFEALREVDNDLNTAVGNWAMRLSTGTENVALGAESLIENDGQGNVALGYGALGTTSSATSGSFNVAIGNLAGQDVDGDNNVFIGKFAGQSAGNVSNQLYIENGSGSPLIYGDFSVDSLVFNADVHITGNVGIGTTTPSRPLHIHNDGIAEYIQSKTTNWSAYTEYGNFDATFRGLIGSDGTNFSGTADQMAIATWTNHPIKFFTNQVERMVITSSGNVGIGTTAPHAPLQFASTVANRKIVLYEGADNDHQFYGFGVQANELRYQVDGTISDHVFYASSSTSSSDELVRITGSGNVGIGVTPATNLHVNDSVNSEMGMIVENKHADGYSILRLRTDAANDLVLFHNGSTRSGGGGADRGVLRNDGGDLAVEATGGDVLIQPSSGIVGIGTESPFGELMVSGADSTDLNLISSSATNHWQAITFGYNNGANLIGRIDVDDNSLDFKTSNGRTIDFYTGPSGASLDTTSSLDLAMSITGDGNVGIGTETPLRQLDVVDNQTSTPTLRVENEDTGTNSSAIAVVLGRVNPTTTNDFVFFFGSEGATLVGSITGNGSGGVQYNTTSDRRLKQNIEPMSNAVSLISKFQPRVYERKALPGVKEFGFIAQELQKVYPQAVSGTPDGDVNTSPMGVDYGQLTPVLVKAIQELNESIEQMKKENLEMQKRIEMLEKQLNK